MDSWTLQDGYPVLTVTRDYNDGSTTISQVRKSNIGMKL
jgi:aminopeptidase N